MATVISDHFKICFVVLLFFLFVFFKLKITGIQFSNRAQIFYIRHKVSSVSHVQIFQQFRSRPEVFSSYCILFEAQLWQHKALIYSEAVGGACRARARRAITLTSNCRQMQPRDGDHKSVSDEPRHSQLICIHPPAGLLSESISTGAETTAAEAGGGGADTEEMFTECNQVRCSVGSFRFILLQIAAWHMANTTTDSED